MSEFENELKQHALMIANEIKKLNPDDSVEIEKAYSIAKAFTGKICPRCMVKDGKANALEIEAIAKEMNFYKCTQCDFNGIFPNDEKY